MDTSEIYDGPDREATAECPTVLLEAPLGDANPAVNGARGFDMTPNDFLIPDRITLAAGVQRSTAQVSTRAADREDDLPAFVGGDQGLDGVLIGQRISIRRAGTFVPLFNGYVAACQEDVTHDGYTFSLEDEKYMLEGQPMLGALVFAPTEMYGKAEEAAKIPEGGLTRYPKGDYYIKTNHPGIFNEGGQPNCIDTPYGPVFAPYPWYGRAPGEKVGSTPMPETRWKVRHWRICDIPDYLRIVFMQRSSDFGPGAQLKFPRDLQGVDGVDPWSQELIWPKNLASSMLSDQELRGGADQVRENVQGLGATARAINFRFGDGFTYHLKAALDRVCESVGRYGIFCKPVDLGRSELSIVPMGWTVNQGAGVAGARVTQFTDSTVQWPKLMLVQLQRDGRGTFSKCTIAGDSVFVERRVTYSKCEEGWGPFDEKYTLLPAWSIEQEDAWYLYIKDNISSYVSNHGYALGRTLAFEAANAKYPQVFAAYFIARDFDYLEGTKYATSAIRMPVSPRVLSHILTYLQDYGSGVMLRRIPLLPQVEVMYAPAGNYRWSPETALDGITVDTQGRIYLPTLRALSFADPNRGSFTGTIRQTPMMQRSDFHARPIRITFAIETDFRTCRSVQLAATGGAAEVDGEGAQFIKGIKLTGVTGANTDNGKLYYRMFTHAGDSYGVLYSSSSRSDSSMVASFILNGSGGGVTSINPHGGSGLGGAVTLNAGLNGDPKGVISIGGAANATPMDPNQDGRWVSPRVRRTYLVDAYGEYRQYLRRDSYPLPESMYGKNGNAMTDDDFKELLGPNGRRDMCATGDELYSEEQLIARHAEKRGRAVLKVARTGRMLWNGIQLWHPGMRCDEMTLVHPRGALLREVHATLISSSWELESQCTTQEWV